MKTPKTPQEFADRINDQISEMASANLQRQAAYWRVNRKDVRNCYHLMEALKPGGWASMIDLTYLDRMLASEMDEIFDGDEEFEDFVEQWSDEVSSIVDEYKEDDKMKDRLLGYALDLLADIPGEATAKYAVRSFLENCIDWEFCGKCGQRFIQEEDRERNPQKDARQQEIHGPGEGCRREEGTA